MTYVIVFILGVTTGWVIFEKPEVARRLGRRLYDWVDSKFE